MPKRQPLTDGSGRYFYPARAHRYQEGTRHNGTDLISLATGDKWEHEELFRTAGKEWVLRRWSDWQGSGESWELIDASEAAGWLIRNGLELPKSLTEAGNRLELGAGRPATDLEARLARIEARLAALEARGEVVP